MAVIEMPDDDEMLKFLLQTGQMRNVVTKALKAWSETESAKVVSQL